MVSEDDPSDTLAPRLKAMGADMTRVHFISGMIDPRKQAFDPASDLVFLENALEEINPVLLIVDPIVSAVTGDSHKIRKRAAVCSRSSILLQRV